MVPGGNELPDAAQFADAFRKALGSADLDIAALERKLAADGHLDRPAALARWLAGGAGPRTPEEYRLVVHVESAIGLGPGDLLRELTAPTIRRVPPEAGRSAAKETVGGTAATPTPAPEVKSLAGELTAGVEFASDFRAKETIRNVLAAFNLVPGADVRHLDVIDEVHIGADRREDYQVTTGRVRAVSEGASRYVAIHSLDEPGGGVPQLQVLEGGYVGQLWSDERLGLTVAEIRLDTKLALGQEHRIVLRQQSPRAGALAFNHSRSSRHTLDHVRVAIIFDAGTIPEHIYGYTNAGGRDLDQEVAVAGNQAVIDLAPFGPGTVGVQWEW